MEAYKYQKVDAFTSGTSMGNPAAIIFLEDKQTLSESAMLDIGKQHKGFVSEVIFCKSNGGIHLTYYSSECEVNFCGHGTIACMYNLIKNIESLLGKAEIPIHTNKKGELTVYNQISEQDAIFISAPNPEYIETDLKRTDITAPLGVSIGDLSDELSVEIIDAGLRTLIIPFFETLKLISIYPNEAELKQFCIDNNVDIILTVSMNACDKSHIAHTRVFAPKFGYLEDPATGSGNSAFGYYMLKHGLWDGALCSVEQGGDNIEFNKVKLHYKDNTMLFGGSATTRINGEYFF